MADSFRRQCRREPLVAIGKKNRHIIDIPQPSQEQEQTEGRPGLLTRVGDEQNLLLLQHGWLVKMGPAGGNLAES